MNQSDRLRIVSAIKGVTGAVLSIDPDSTVTETIKSIYNKYSVDYFYDRMIFANGGDRTVGNSPEEEYCQWRGINTVYNVGGAKTQSSSHLLKGKQDA